jgi:hypothetical protein
MLRQTVHDIHVAQAKRVGQPVTAGTNREIESVVIRSHADRTAHPVDGGFQGEKDLVCWIIMFSVSAMGLNYSRPWYRSSFGSETTGHVAGKNRTLFFGRKPSSKMPHCT